MKKIGIMGGTFDPIHNGHLMLAQQAYEQYKLDHVIFLPTGIPPHKHGIIASGEDRKKMVELAISGCTYFSCSDLEVRQKKTTYTAHSLTYFCERNPNSTFYYIVGADSLDYMEQWYHPEIIFQKAVVLAAMRNTESHEEVSASKKLLEKRYNAVIHFLDCPPFDISSSEVRECVRQEIPITGKIPDAVIQYMEKHQLYRQ